MCQTYLLFFTVYSTLWQLSAGILASSVATMHEVKQLKKKTNKNQKCYLLKEITREGRGGGKTESKTEVNDKIITDTLT